MVDGGIAPVTIPPDDAIEIAELLHYVADLPAESAKCGFKAMSVLPHGSEVHYSTADLADDARRLATVIEEAGWR